jgi:arsenite methyltransferase
MHPNLCTRLSVIRPGGLDLTERAISQCKFAAGALIADIGCGSGATVEHLGQRHSLDAIGIDIRFEVLKEGGMHSAGIPLLQGDASELPFASEVLDGIITECSLSVMRDKDAALKEFSRVLKEGGMLILTDIIAESPEAVDSLPGYDLPFCLSGMMTCESLAKSLERCGFRIDVLEDHSHLLKSFIGRIIMESDNCDTGFVRGLEALKRARPRYILLGAKKGEHK